MEKTKLFVFDCDDILLDWCAGMRAYLITKYPDIEFNSYYPTSYDLAGWVASEHIPPASEFIADFADSEEFQHLQPMELAPECVKLLKHEIDLLEADVEMCVLTKCGLGKNGSTLLRRIVNIREVFGKGVFDHVFVIEPWQSKHDILQGLKEQYNVIGVVDDNVHNNYISSCLDIPSYILKRPNNAHGSLPYDVVMCEDWDEIYSNLRPKID